MSIEPGPGQAAIYVLVDPGDNTVRYVGTTIQPKIRKSAHLSGKDWMTTKAIAAWVRELKAIGLLPSMYIVDVCPFVESLRVETSWIDRYGIGNLFNHARITMDRKPPKCLSSRVYARLRSERAALWSSATRAG